MLVTDVGDESILQLITLSLGTNINVTLSNSIDLLSEQYRFIGREKHNAICIFEPKFLGKFLTDKPFSWVLLIPSSCWRSSEWQLMSMIRMISSWISAIFNPIIFAPYLRIMNIHECTLICPYAHTVHLMFQSSLCNRNTINMDKKVPESSLYWGVVCWQN